MRQTAGRSGGRERQNQPGEVEYPVGFRRRYVFEGTARRDGGHSRFLRRAGILLACVFVGGLIAKVATLVGVVPPEARFDLHFLLIGLGVAGFTVGHIYLDGSAPRRAQDAYLAASGAPDLTPHQRSLLALTAVTDFDGGLWGSTLELHPSWAVLPARLRGRHRDGMLGTPWVAMPMAPLHVIRDHLDQEFRVTDESSLRLHVLDRLDTDSWSLSFLRAVRHGDSSAVSRVASLTGTSELDVLACAQPRGERPPALLWGEDLRQMAHLVRAGFTAGYVGREDAWELLDRIGQVAAALFETVDDYWVNVRLGYAARMDSLSAVRDLDLARSGLRASRWPAASATLPARTPTELPDAVRDPHAHLDRASGLAP